MLQLPAKASFVWPHCWATHPLLIHGPREGRPFWNDSHWLIRTLPWFVCAQVCACVFHCERAALSLVGGLRLTNGGMVDIVPPSAPALIVRTAFCGKKIYGTESLLLAVRRPTGTASLDAFLPFFWGFLLENVGVNAQESFT